MPALRSGTMIRAREPLSLTRSTPIVSEQFASEVATEDLFNDESMPVYQEKIDTILADNTEVQPNNTAISMILGEKSLTTGETEFSGFTQTIPATTITTAIEALSDSILDDMIVTNHLAIPECPSIGSVLATEELIHIYVDPRLVTKTDLSAHTAIESTGLDSNLEDQYEAVLGQMAPKELEVGTETKRPPHDNAPLLGGLEQQHMEVAEPDIIGADANSFDMTDENKSTAIMIPDEINSGKKSLTMSGEDSNSAIAIPDDDQAQITKSSRSRRRAPKRSFTQYVESENLWMNSTLGDLTDILKSTREHIVSLNDMEQRLIAAQDFIKDCGAKEKKVTEHLEKSK